jgi:hypothetical protein
LLSLAPTIAVATAANVDAILVVRIIAAVTVLFFGTKIHL